MALITQEAIKNPDFVEISGTRSYQMAPTKKNAEGGYVANHHNMVKQNTLLPIREPLPEKQDTPPWQEIPW